MLIHKAYKYELKPNKTQLALFNRYADCARFIWNWGLARKKELWEKEQKSISAFSLHNELVELKRTDENYKWLYDISSDIPITTLDYLDKAFQNFFRGLKQGRKVGYPKFKAKGRYDAFTLRGRKNQKAIEVFPKAVKLPKLGVIRLKEKTDNFKADRILRATVSRRADRWFVSIIVELEIPEPEQPYGEPIGVDVGLMHFAVLSDGTKIEAPKFLDKSMKRLKRLSRQLSRKKKGSNNFKKAAMKLARLHMHVSNQREYFLHNLSKELVCKHKAIVIEDLAVKNMVKNDHLSKSISDAGWGEFRRQLEYKTQWYGSLLVVADRFYPSSKACSECGYVLPKLNLSIRIWECPNCGEIHDRDINAAKNLVKWYNININNGTEVSSGIYACGDRSCGGTDLVGSTSTRSLKQEADCS